MTHTYHGFTIRATGTGFSVDGQRFTTIGAARAFIDAQFL